MSSTIMLVAAQDIRFTDMVLLNVHGKSAYESTLINGYTTLNCVVVLQAVVKKVINTKITCFDFSFQKGST